MGIAQDVAALEEKLEAMSRRLDELIGHLRRARLVSQATDGQGDQGPDDGPTGEEVAT